MPGGPDRRDPSQLGNTKDNGQSQETIGWSKIHGFAKLKLIGEQENVPHDQCSKNAAAEAQTVVRRQVLMSCDVSRGCQHISRASEPTGCIWKSKAVAALLS